MASGHFRLRTGRRSAPPVPDPRFVADSRGVEFERARPQRDATGRAALGSIVYLVLGVWSLVPAFDGQLILGAICALLWFEFALLNARLTALAAGAVEDPHLAARVATALRYVCIRAGCPLPRVSLRGDARRSAAVVSRKGRVMLVLSRDLGNMLTDDELQGILAHEVAHVALRDLETARGRGLWTAAGIPLLLFSGLAAIGHQDVFGQPPLLGGLWAIVAVAVALPLTPSSRRRELRADAYAAALTANLDALASAVTKCHTAAEDARRRMLSPALLRWALIPVAWRLPTHPKLAQRVMCLRSGASGSPALAAVVADPPTPPTRRVTIAAWLTVLAGLAVVISTILPWMTETDASIAYLTYTDAGVYSYGWLALVGGIVIATLGACLAGMTLRRGSRIAMSLSALAVSWGCAGVVVARVHELAGLVSGGDPYTIYAPALGIYVAGAAAAVVVAVATALVVCSAMLRGRAGVDQLHSASGSMPGAPRSPSAVTP